MTNNVINYYLDVLYNYEPGHYLVEFEKLIHN